MADRLQELIDSVRFITEAKVLNDAKLIAEGILKKLEERKATNNRVFAIVDDAPERVFERFNIDEDELHNRSHENSYWSDASVFYGEVKNRFVSTLTSSQLSWLDKLEEQLND